MKKTTILFDLDGTLIDSTRAIYEGFIYAFSKYNLTVDTDKVHALIGYPLDEMLVRLGVKESQKWEFVSHYKDYYREACFEKTTLLPYANEAIELAFGHATLGVVTTKTGTNSIELLKYLGVMSYFDVVIGREDVTNPKPHPEPILKALHTLHVEPNNAWMIGDTTMDMVSAASANVKGVGVACGHSSLEALKSCALHVEPNSLEAVKYILNIYNPLNMLRI